MAETLAPSQYEQAQIENIRSWREKPPGVVEQAAGIVLSPLSRFIGAVVPSGAIESVLRASDWVAERSVRNAAEIDAAAPLEIRDREAEKVRQWAIGYASGEGAIAGAVGLMSLPVDIPALVTLSLRTIRRIGLIYGYAGESEEERHFIYGVLSVAGANSMPQKLAALNTLRGLETKLLAQNWAALGDHAARRAVHAEALLLFIRDVADQLGVNLTRRKALAAVPIAGAVIGAAMNAWYMRDVAKASQFAFQERWLRDRNLLTE